MLAHDLASPDGKLRSVATVTWRSRGILHSHAVEGAETNIGEVCSEHGILALAALLQDLKDHVVGGIRGA